VNKLKYIISLLIPIFIATHIYSQAEINFFVDYNLLTFSSFSDIINFNVKNNIKQYIEYNEIIPVYLSWEKKETFNQIKNLFIDKKLSFVKINYNFDENDKQKLWFHQEKEKLQDKIFSNFVSASKIPTFKNGKLINIFNFTELSKILNTLSSNKKISQNYNFKVDLNLFLSSNIDKYFDMINKHNQLKFNFYIVSDTKYEAENSEIKKLIDTAYSLKFNYSLTPYQNRIYDLSLLFFTLHLSPSLDDFLLNFLPLLTLNSSKGFSVKSTEYELSNKKYITLFDNNRFFIFDPSNGHLKKWTNYKLGISIINLDSLIETVYTAIKLDSKYELVTPEKIDYLKFPNGINFKITTTNNLYTEKNIILQNGKLLLSYRIKNMSNRKKYYILKVENKFSPSLYDMLINLHSNLSLYNISKKNPFTSELTELTRGIINMDTGYGIYIDSYNEINGLEIFKGFYFFNFALYYRFSLYPFETKNITLLLQKKHISNKIISKYKKRLYIVENQKWGECEPK